jgi:hypothetical protein
MSIECYAQRLLNPFRGVVHTIRYMSAEALTTDGVEWDIYVANDALLDGLGRAGKRAQISDIRYGHWSAEKGLKRGPLYPSEDFRRMEAMGAVVFDHLTRLHEQVPFPLRDRYEFWLLDREGLPLALLDSVLSAADMVLDRPVEWRPGTAARERFHSTALGSDTAQGTADALAAYLHRFAGPRPAAQWFSRDDGGGGEALGGVNLATGWAVRSLGAEVFPELLLAGAGHDAIHQRLIEEFQNWQAAWLLTLALPVATRTRLEGYVHLQAPLVEGLCRLYPEVIDPAAINAARVEALFIKSQGNTAGPVPDQLSTFYIELNPAGGHYT